MKKIIFFLCITFTGWVSAQKTAKDSPLIPYRIGEKWGFCDPAMNMVIPCKYADALPFDAGIGQLQDEQGKWHLVTESGKISKGIEADFLTVFSNQMVVFKKDEKYGLMNSKGKVLANNVYEEFINFYGNDATWIKKGNKYGALNTKGKEVIPPIYDGVSGPENETFAVKKEGKYAIFTTSGKQLTDFVYEQVNLLSDDVFTVKKGTNWLLLDKKCQFIKDLGDSYAFVGGFEQGLARISKNGKWGFLAVNGAEVVAPIYASTGCLGDGLFVYYNDKQEIVIDKTGKILHDDLDYAKSFVNQCALVDQNDKVGVMNPQGKIIVPFKYALVNEFFMGAYTVAELAGKKIIIDNQGKEYFATDKYASIESDTGNLFLVNQEGKKLGYIDKNGKEFWQD